MPGIESSVCLQSPQIEDLFLGAMWISCDVCKLMFSEHVEVYVYEFIYYSRYVMSE